MKKFALLMLSFFACINTFAFDFDGINLNGTFTEISRAISKKNYVTTPDRPEALTGLCQGTKIYLTFDRENVTEKGHIGKLTVEIPNNDADAFVNNAQLLNVIYHQIDNTEAGYLYSVDQDGTQLLLSRAEGVILLTYITPYYKAKN